MQVVKTGSLYEFKVTLDDSITQEGWQTLTRVIALGEKSQAWT